MAAARILIATIGRPHGVRGLVHVHAYAEDAAALPGYGPFSDDRGRSFSLRWRGDGIAEIAEIVGGAARTIADRDAAGRLTNMRLYAERDRLPQPEGDEFYWADLVGLEAVGVDGKPLGRVSAVHDYGAGTSLEIGDLLVPFTLAAVPAIDLAAGRVTVSPPQDVSQ